MDNLRFAEIMNTVVDDLMEGSDSEYARNLLFQRCGLTDTEIRELGLDWLVDLVPSVNAAMEPGKVADEIKEAQENAEETETPTLLALVNLLDALCALSLLHRDPKNRNNILNYREGVQLEGLPESGWFSQNIFELAQELLDDRDSRESLFATIRENGYEISYKGRSYPGSLDDKFILTNEKGETYHV